MHLSKTDSKTFLLGCLKKATLCRSSISHSHQLVPNTSIAAHLQGAGPTIPLSCCVCLPLDRSSLLTNSLFVLCRFLCIRKKEKKKKVESKSWATVVLPTALWGSMLPGCAGIGMASFWIFTKNVLGCFVVNWRLFTEFFGTLQKKL